MWLSFRMLNWHWQWFDGWVFNVVYCSTGEGTGTHSSTLAWRIPWTEEPGGLQSMGSLRVGHDWATSLSLFTVTHWRRRWQPLQCSCLENPGDGGAWWAAVYGVARSDTTEVTQQQQLQPQGRLCEPAAQRGGPAPLSLRARPRGPARSWRLTRIDVIVVKSPQTVL